MINLDIIDQFKYVSFDLFDTLIFRTFSSPSGVFDYTQLLYNRHHDSTPLKNFTKERMAAEKRTRKKNGWGEVNLNEIYNELGFSDEKCEELKKTEMYVEISNCIPNKEMIEFALSCHELGKKVIITTDMYLPKNCIEDILKKIGVTYDRLFISGEIKKTKESGELFDYVVEQLGIRPMDIVHIGDNENSDYKRPRNRGIDAIHYKRSRQHFPYNIDNKKYGIQIDHFNSLINNGYTLKDTKYPVEYKIGFSVMGPVLADFCAWIHEMKESLQLDKLLFVAREGYAIKKCYELMYPEDTLISYYVKLNKHVLRTPLLCENDFLELLKRTLKNKKECTLNEVLKSFDIHEDMIYEDEIEKKCPFELNDIINLETEEPEKLDELRDFILGTLSSTIVEQGDLLEEYISSYGVQGKRIGLINNSYNGNGQKLLEDFLKKRNIQCNIYGLQFAGNEKCRSSLGENYRTWIPNSRKASLKGYLFERGSLVFEHLLFEPSGTSVKLERSGDGKVKVVCETPRTEVDNFDKIFAAQQGMLDFIKCYKSSLKERIGFEAIMYFVNLIQAPTVEAALSLGNLNDDDTDCDRHIIDFNTPFSLGILYKNNIYNKVSWVQGYLRGKGISDMYLHIFNARLYLTNLYHEVRNNGK